MIFSEMLKLKCLFPVEIAHINVLTASTINTIVCIKVKGILSGINCRLFLEEICRTKIISVEGIILRMIFLLLIRNGYQNLLKNTQNKSGFLHVLCVKPLLKNLLDY